MSVIKIDIEKVSQEFEIAGKTYVMSWNDEAIFEYLDFAEEHQAMIEKMDKIDLAKLSKPERDEIKVEQLDVLEGFLDKIFGSGSFETIYDDVGRSMMNLNKVIETVTDYLTDKANESKKQKRQKYTKK